MTRVRPTPRRERRAFPRPAGRSNKQRALQVVNGRRREAADRGARGYDDPESRRRRRCGQGCYGIRHGNRRRHFSSTQQRLSAPAPRFLIVRAHGGFPAGAAVVRIISRRNLRMGGCLGAGAGCVGDDGNRQQQYCQHLVGHRGHVDRWMPAPTNGHVEYAFACGCAISTPRRRYSDTARFTVRGRRPVRPTAGRGVASIDSRLAGAYTTTPWVAGSPLRSLRS